MKKYMKIIIAAAVVLLSGTYLVGTRVNAMNGNRGSNCTQNGQANRGGMRMFEDDYEDRCSNYTQNDQTNRGGMRMFEDDYEDRGSDYTQNDQTNRGEMRMFEDDYEVRYYENGHMRANGDGSSCRREGRGE